MTILEPTTVAAARAGALQTLGLLLIGLAPWPVCWQLVGTTLENAKSPELNRAEREASAAGYYEGLIGGGDGPQGARGELALRLMGKPGGWIQFQDADVTRDLDDDFLLFELKPNVRRNLFGRDFETNSLGLPGKELTTEKPEGTCRIATLGSSMDMGWGVSSDETYSSRLETWLNSHARVRAADGPEAPRRFEVLNFAVAAYSPLQRLESFRRKVRPMQPDIVLYSATMLDLRLLEIHLCELLRLGLDLKYDFLRKAVADAKITKADLALDADDRLIHKERVKAKFRPFYWAIYDETIRILAEDCRSAGIPLALAIIPRVGKADAPEVRAESVARLGAIAAHQGLAVYDLADTYDRLDPAELEIAAWDDHPNALGHQRLFLGLARAMAKDREVYTLMFPTRADRGEGPATVPEYADLRARERPPGATRLR